MEYEVVILFIIAILNSLFSYAVVRGEKNTTNIIFSFIALSVSLWALNIAFFIRTQDINSAFIFANIYYLSAAIIPSLFFYFSLVFPHTDKKLKIHNLVFLVPLIYIGVSLLDKNFILTSIDMTSYGKEAIINRGHYLVYTIYFVTFILISYFNLLKKYKEVGDEIEKIQIRYVLWGTGVAYVFGSIFNLLLPWLGDYSQIWLGPFFSILMVLSLVYAIIKHHLFNIKVIITEVLIFALWFFIVVRVIISNTVQEQMINGVLLLIVVVLGLFLINSMLKEIASREHIEALADELAMANVRLRELDKQKSEFVSIASHQLRSPLTAIKGYSSMLLEGSFAKIPVKNREPIERIFQSSVQMTDVVEDFLNVTRIEQGRMQYDFEKIDVYDLFESVVNGFEQSINESGLIVKLEKGGGEPFIADIDGHKFRQVAVNLIDNSIKYTPKGSITIKIGENKKRSCILISIKDTGIGIPNSFKHNLFEKFSRAENSKKIHANGSGIGLYIVSEIVKAHNGRIWAESGGDDKGTTFFIEIPRAKYKD